MISGIFFGHRHRHSNGSSNNNYDNANDANVGKNSDPEDAINGGLMHSLGHFTTAFSAFGHYEEELLHFEINTCFMYKVATVQS